VDIVVSCVKVGVQGERAVVGVSGRMTRSSRFPDADSPRTAEDHPSEVAVRVAADSVLLVVEPAILGSVAHREENHMRFLAKIL
jgi:hypothetical protein